MWFTNNRATVMAAGLVLSTMTSAAVAAEPLSRRQLLLAGSRDPNARIRKASVTALAEFKDPTISDALIDLANDPDPSVREATVRTLAAAPTPKCFDIFVKVLADRNLRWKAAAVEGLAKLKDPRCVEPLVGLLRAPSDYDAQLARRVIISLGEGAVPAVAQAIKSRESLRRDLVQILLAIGTAQARTALAKAVADDDATVRLAVVQALAVPDKAPLAEPLLKTAVEDSDPSVRLAAMQSMAALCATGHVPEALASSVLKGLSHPDPKLRAGAVALSTYAPKDQVLQPLIKLLQDPEVAIRRKVAQKLSYTTDPVVLSPLIKAMEDTDPAVSRDAAIGVARFNRPEAIPFLKKLAIKSTHSDREICRMLAGLGPKGIDALLEIVAANVPSSKGAERMLIDKRDGQVFAGARDFINRAATPEGRRLFVNIIASFKDSAAAAALGETLKHPDQTTRQSAGQGLIRMETDHSASVLAKAFKDLDPKIRLELVKSMGDYSEVKLAPVIDAATQDSEPMVLAATAYILTKKRNPQTLAVMCRLVDRGVLKESSPLPDMQKNMFLDVLGRFEDTRATPTLLRALKDRTMPVQTRRSIAYALGATGGPGAGEALLACAAEKDENLQEGCAWALGQLHVKAASKILQELSADEKTLPFNRAAVALAAVDSRAAHKPFLALLRRSPEDAELLKMMQHAKDGDVVDVLVAALESRKQIFRAAHWLGQIGDERAVAPMERLVSTLDNKDLRDTVSNQLHWVRIRLKRAARSGAATPPAQPPE
ncbi:MAG: HEAT repeat domain-containing protein [Planctomycetaceae bacterium]|nr:HEAT repeat domain-containing protein [Planctomycetaceae bacterium]